MSSSSTSSSSSTVLSLAQTLSEIIKSVTKSASSGTFSSEQARDVLAVVSQVDIVLSQMAHCSHQPNPTEEIYSGSLMNSMRAEQSLETSSRSESTKEDSTSAMNDEIKRLKQAITRKNLEITFLKKKIEALEHTINEVLAPLEKKVKKRVRKKVKKFEPSQD